MTGQVYDRIGVGYAERRRPDPRIARAIHAALGDARSVLNVGAGAGSYEPLDRPVVAVEISRRMLAQRGEAAPAVQASAMALPFGDRRFDASLAILTIHHWPEPARGLAELRRVARRRTVIFTFEPGKKGFWLTDDYFPELPEIDRENCPSLGALEETLGPIEVQPVEVPHDCTDGFLGAYWRRPEAYLDPSVRGAISSFALLPDIEARIERLRADLADGSWHRRHGHWLARESADLGYRLVVARAEAP